jgi:2,6-dihydroxypyridine 3-monooxygenase
MVDRSPGPERPFINWLWYRNVPKGSEFEEFMTDREGTMREVSLPPGFVRERQVEELREAAASALPPSLVEVVQNTGTPYIQAIFDAEVSRMAFGRVCLIGDGAFAARPHAAVGTAKAAENGYRLGETIKETNRDVVAALKRWEPSQLELGKKVLVRTREAGNRSQFEGTWRVGDPLPFGLYEVGDSEMSVGDRIQ